MEPANEQSAASAPPVRYELDPVFQVRKKNRKPALALDVANDAVWVIDADTTALVASSSRTQVTATPVRCKHVESDGDSTSTYWQPVLVLGVPGLQPLTIGTNRTKHSKWGGRAYQYVWRDKVARADKPNYLVKEEQWRELAEKFGLGTLVVDRLASGDIARSERRGRILGIAGIAFFLLVVLLGWITRHLAWVHNHLGM
jgi:hypothetical protein